MKNNRIAFLLTFVLILIALAMYWTNQHKNTLNDDASFAVSDTASVTRIFIAGMDDNEVLLERVADGWTVNKHFKAQTRKVDDLLNTMMKLRVRTPVSKASQDNVITRMAGMAVKVEVYQQLPRIEVFGLSLFPREVKSLVYYVGDAPKDNLGTFMLKEGAETAYIMQITGFKGFLSTRYSSIQDNWRDHTVFRTKLNDISSVRLEFNEKPDESYQIERVGKHNYSITLLNKQQQMEAYDTIRVLNFLSAFADIRFESMLNNLPKNMVDSITSSPFLHKLKLTDIHGQSFEVTTFTKKRRDQNTVDELSLQPVDLDRMYALVNDGKDFVLIQYFVFDKVLRPAKYFIPGSPEDY